MIQAHISLLSLNVLRSNPSIASERGLGFYPPRGPCRCLHTAPCHWSAMTSEQGSWTSQSVTGRWLLLVHIYSAAHPHLYSHTPDLAPERLFLNTPLIISSLSNSEGQFPQRWWGQLFRSVKGGSDWARVSNSALTTTVNFRTLWMPSSCFAPSSWWEKTLIQYESWALEENLDTGALQSLGQDLPGRPLCPYPTHLSDLGPQVCGLLCPAIPAHMSRSPTHWKF